MRRNIVKRTDRKKGKIKLNVRAPLILLYIYTRLLYLSTACNHIITLRGNIRVCPQCPLLKGFSKQMFHDLMYHIHDVYTRVYYNGVPSAQWIISFDRV